MIVEDFMGTEIGNLEELYIFASNDPCFSGAVSCGGAGVFA